MALNRHILFSRVIRSQLNCHSLSRSCCECATRNASTVHDNDALRRIRNIGILAHIDAGKTTTTERMLFFSGKINSMGEVHHGNTVTDYMEQERNRGITITSASVSFSWKEHQINLVDTPGHIDFTNEVENALNVIDGCVVVLDSSAGVEAQTLTVWRQADSKRIPRIVYANKMDRQDASLPLCVETLQRKVGTEVFVTQIPISEGHEFVGIVDLLYLNKLLWTRGSKGKEEFHEAPLDEIVDGVLWAEAMRSREVLIDKLSAFDDKLAEDIILSESLENISAATLSSALRRSTISCHGVPLLCGSSYKNKAVQPLMDAIVRYLPSPLEQSNRTLLQNFNDDLCAQVFKVVHNTYLGPVTFLRLYSGEISQKDKVFNLRLQIPEKCVNVMVATADDFENVPSVKAGNIAVVSGFIETRAGDLLASSASAAQNACKKIAQAKGISEDEAGRLLGVGQTPPDPVFFCSVEAPSQSQQVALEKALERLQKEDPSLSVTFNEETSQIILGGMGELHLDIIKERLQTEYKLDILLGPIQIAYREALQSSVEERITIEECIGSSSQFVELDILLEPILNKGWKDTIKFHSDDHEKQQKMEKLKANRKIFQALNSGVKEGLRFGPKIHCPLLATKVTLRDIVIGKGTSPPMISSATSQCMRKALQNADTLLMEPIMNVEVVLNEEHQSVVSADLSRRRADVIGIGDRHIHRVIQARVPLSEMLGYANKLRSITSGTATFSMQFQEYQALPQELEDVVIKKETGLYQ